MPQTKYTVGYHNLQQHKEEICEYAVDAYSAMQQAKEDVPFLEGHPHFIDYCTKDNTTEVNNIFRLMSSGIPMGH